MVLLHCLLKREKRRRGSGKEEKKWQRGEEVTKSRRTKEQKYQRIEEPKSRRSDKEQKNQRAEESKSRIGKE